MAEHRVIVPGTVLYRGKKEKFDLFVSKTGLAMFLLRGWVEKRNEYGF